MRPIQPLHLYPIVGAISSYTFFVNLFLSQNNSVPSTLYLDHKLDIDKVVDLLTNEFDLDIITTATSFYGNKKPEYNKYPAFKSKNGSIMIYIETDVRRSNKARVLSNYSYIMFDRNYEEQALKIIEGLKTLKQVKERVKNKINIVALEGTEFTIKNFDIKKPKLNLEFNYNDDLIDINKLIVTSLNKKDNKGLVLLYGNPGCGKTNYIKFLLSTLKKKVIYLPPNLANEISSPSFVNFLSKHPNSILVIEDGENILKSRKSGENQAISNILNISDGLLSDILNIQIVATFNCGINDIDQALLRKGRLIAKYEFGKLTPTKAQSLSDKLKFDTKIEQEMTLSEIYNQADRSFENAPKIGMQFQFSKK